MHLNNLTATYDNTRVPCKLAREGFETRLNVLKGVLVQVEFLAPPIIYRN